MSGIAGTGPPSHGTLSGSLTAHAAVRWRESSRPDEKHRARADISATALRWRTEPVRGHLLPRRSPRRAVKQLALRRMGPVLAHRGPELEFRHFGGLSPVVAGRFGDPQLGRVCAAEQGKAAATSNGWAIKSTGPRGDDDAGQAAVPARAVLLTTVVSDVQHAAARIGPPGWVTARSRGCCRPPGWSACGI